VKIGRQEPLEQDLNAADLNHRFAEGGPAFIVSAQAA
jgi:hypothetical protein